MSADETRQSDEQAQVVSPAELRASGFVVREHHDEQAHVCASEGYPRHQPSRYCLCICGKRFDALRTRPDMPHTTATDDGATT